MQINQFGIPEPKFDNKVDAKELHFIMIPLLAINKMGYRVGYGKGFYDRFLLYCTENTLKIGINIDAYSINKKIKKVELRQICEGLYRLKHDIRIILMSGPNYRDNLLELVKEISLDFVSPSFKTESILEVSALIEKLDMVITPDTSIVHIASAFNIPVISIHEKNNESFRLWAPTSKLNNTVFSKSDVGLFNYNVDQLLSSAGDIIKTIELDQ